MSTLTIIPNVLNRHIDWPVATETIVLLLPTTVLWQLMYDCILYNNVSKVEQ